MGLDEEDLRLRFAGWVERVKRMHDHVHVLANETVAFTPLVKPVASAKLALVTTAGVHLREQEPFDLAAPEGDWSVRPIPSDVDPSRLTVSHAHYDTTAAETDVDCVFPITTVRQLVAAGVVGSLADTFYGLMGFIPDGRPLLQETAPQIVGALQAEGVDVVLLTPG
jgi:D-proline reductase (dithiol) PrdB